MNASETLGDWLRLVGSAGWASEEPWDHVQAAARAAAQTVGRRVRIRPGEEEDVVSDVLLVARTSTEAWSRQQVSDVPLVVWLTGVME